MADGRKHFLLNCADWSLFPSICSCPAWIDVNPFWASLHQAAVENPASANGQQTLSYRRSESRLQQRSRWEGAVQRAATGWGYELNHPRHTQTQHPSVWSEMERNTTERERHSELDMEAGDLVSYVEGRVERNEWREGSSTSCLCCYCTVFPHTRTSCCSFPPHCWLTTDFIYNKLN